LITGHGLVNTSTGILSRFHIEIKMEVIKPLKSLFCEETEAMISDKKIRDNSPDRIKDIWYF
jgi:hypothetical protein